MNFPFLATIEYRMGGFMMSAILWFDETVMAGFQFLRQFSGLDPLMLFFTRLGDGGFLWLLTGLILLAVRKTRRSGAALLLTLALCTVIGNFWLKPLIGRIRPCYFADPAELLIPCPRDFSFPSGHTMTSIGAAGVLALFFGRRGAIAYLPAVLISLSRLYLGVHYPTDVLGGALLGTVIACLVTFTLESAAILRRTGARKV